MGKPIWVTLSKQSQCFVSDILKTDEAVEAFEYFEGSTLTIEIIKDDVLQKLYFRVKDKVSTLRAAP